MNPKKGINSSKILSAATFPATGSSEIEQASSNQGSLNLNSLLKAPLKLAATFNHFVLYHHLHRADRCAREGREGKQQSKREKGRWRIFNIGSHDFLKNLNIITPLDLVFRHPKTISPSVGNEGLLNTFIHSSSAQVRGITLRGIIRQRAIFNYLNFLLHIEDVSLLRR